jgi:hypothetical protein
MNYPTAETAGYLKGKSEGHWGLYQKSELVDIDAALRIKWKHGARIFPSTRFYAAILTFDTALFLWARLD